MILFELKCGKDHRFEAWFRDGAAYDAQVRAGAIDCPLCGDTEVTKAPMAPRLIKGKDKPDAAEVRAKQVAMQILQAVDKLCRQVETNCDYVGDRFPEEARRIHYGETDPRGIFGEATGDEATALDDEGIEFTRIPWIPRRTN